MAIDKKGIPFHPEEYNPDYPRIKCKQCGLMNSCEHDLVDAEPWYPRLPILLEGGMVQSIDDFVLHTWTEWSLKAIRDGKVINHKLVMDKFIHPELLYNLLENWPKEMYDIECKGRLQADKDCNIIFEELYNKVFDNEYIKCAIADKFALENEYSTDMWLWQDTEQFRVNDVHIDHPGFDITFGLYLPRDKSLSRYGTQFWLPKEQENDLEKSLIRENCTLIDQIPFLAGTTYFMPRTSYSWHSSPILDKEMIRNHVYGYYSAL